MKTRQTSSFLRSLPLLAIVALWTTLPLTSRAAIWTNQLGGYWLDTNNWSNLDVPRGGGTSGEADFRGDWLTSGELVITTDLTPVSPETGIPRFRNVIYNDTGADPDATLKITGTNALVFYHATAGSYPWINAAAASSVVRVDVEIGSQTENTIAISCGNDNARVYFDKQQTSLSAVYMNRGTLYLNGGNNTLPTNSVLGITASGNVANYFYFNGNSQELAGLFSLSYQNQYRFFNGSATPVTLTLNVPAGSNYVFQGRLGFNRASANPTTDNNITVVKKGLGIQTLNMKRNAYTGPTIIEEGILNVDNEGDHIEDGPWTTSLGTWDAGTTVNAGATLNIQGTGGGTGGGVFSEPLTISGNGFEGIGALRFSGDGTGIGIGITWKGLITLGADATVQTGPTNTALANCTGGFTDNGLGYGLTKIGSGTLILSPATLAGNSSLSEGALYLGAWSSLNSLTVASSAILGVTNAVTVNTLTFNAGTAVLNIGYGDVAGVNPTGAAINNTTLANNATVTVNVTGSGFTTTGGSPIVLLDYGTKSGTGSFIKGTLPPGIVGTITDNGSQIVLNITAAVNDLTWSGSVNGNWDLATFNWNSGVAKYQETGGIGDIVKFFDGANTYNVTVTTTVSPAAMTVNNSFGAPYTFSGSGKISGDLQLRKEGFGPLNLNTANDYSGGTVILNGTVQVGHNTALGQGTIYLNEFASPQPLSLIVLSSDSATPRTLPNSVYIAAAGGTLNVATLGDPMNNGLLTISGPVDFLPLATHNVTMNSDVTFSGGVVSGGMNKLGPGTWTVTGAPASFTRGFDVRDGTLVFSAVNATNTGTIRTDAENASLGFARIVITNGAVVTTGNDFGLGNDSGGVGQNYFDVSATCLAPNGGILMNRNRSTYSEFNLLAGGDVTVQSVGVTGANTYPTRFNFNGGTLRAALTSSTFMQGLTEVMIQDGGATIDSGGYDIDISQPLLGTGGLTKLGSGRLSLEGTNTFTGNIQVNEGDLTLQSRHEGSGSVTCADGTTLGLVSTETNAVLRLSAATLGSSVGGILKCRFGGQDGHQATQPVAYVTNLTLSGTIQVDVTRFGLVVPGSIIPLVGYGSLSGTPTLVRGALTGVADADWVVVNNTTAKQIQLVPAPTLSWQPVPGGLELQWPILGTFVQSNAVSVANPAFWFDMAGTDSVTNLIIIPNPALTNVYYRLRLP